MKPIELRVNCCSHDCSSRNAVSEVRGRGHHFRPPVSVRRIIAAGDDSRREDGEGLRMTAAHTFKRRKATVEDELKIANVTLSKDKSGKLLGLGQKLGLARQIANEKVL